MENYSYNPSYPESGGSSPRSREVDFDNPPPWDESQGGHPPANYKVKFMCSYGGKIHPRPHDNQLSYIGGETKILAVDRNIRFGPLLSKLVALYENDDISFKYQLPDEDLDALISVTNNDDLEHMMHEYERLYRVSPKPARLRIFIFPNQSQSLNSSVRSFASDEGKSEKERFVEALNTAPILTTPPHTVPVVAAPQPHPPTSNVDLLFGLEKPSAMAGQQPSALPPMIGKVRDMEAPVVVPGIDERYVGLDPIQKHIQDLQRLRLEEQQGIYRRKSDDNMTGGFTGGEYYKVPEKASQATIPADGVPYWTDKQVPVGAYPASSASTEQPVYMIPAPSNAYHAPPPPMVRQMPVAPNPGYYTVQRVPPEVYREQQQMYGAIPHATVPSMAAPPPPFPPQKAAGYSEGFGMMRPPPNSGGIGIVTEAGYAPVAYDNATGRQVIYSAPGGAVVAAQYQAVGGAMHPDAAGIKPVPKVTQIPFD